MKWCEEGWYKGTRWISSLDGGWKTARLFRIEEARRLWKSYKAEDIGSVRKILAEHEMIFHGEIIRLHVAKQKRNPDVAMVYLHVSMVPKLSKKRK